MLLTPVKPKSVYFVSCPKQSLEMKALLSYKGPGRSFRGFLSLTGSGFQPSAAPLYPNMGEVPLRANFTALARVTSSVQVSESIL